VGEQWKAEYGLPAAVAVAAHPGEAVFGMAGPVGSQQFVAFGDCVSVCERLVHRARAGEIVMSLEFVKALGSGLQAIGAKELPPIEIPKRAPVQIFSIAVETRLDFT
jgi:class 3 adenylate cyclase